MLAYIRYALATVCFAASVGCLALWSRSYRLSDRFEATFPGPHSHEMAAWTFNGTLIVTSERSLNPTPVGLRWERGLIAEWCADLMRQEMVGQGPFGQLHFGPNGPGRYFPLWYPALLFGLAGSGALRLGRRFTIRWAIIGTTVVAGLLGMAVWL